MDNGTLRLIIFLSATILFSCLEAIFPKRKRLQKRSFRWPINFGLSLMNTIALVVLLPLSALEFAMLVEKNQWGLFHLLELSIGMNVFLSIVFLDIAIYLQHIAFHKAPILWRLHRVHHNDVDLDVSSGIRFHVIEIFLSIGYKFVLIATFGAAPISVLIFEIILNSCALFHHANLNLPQWLDRSIRVLLVTPDMHRIHHSQEQKETDSNFGFSFSFWDRLFNTYVPKAENLVIGLKEYTKPKDLRLWALLKNPFRKN